MSKKNNSSLDFSYISTYKKKPPNLHDHKISIEGYQLFSNSSHNIFVLFDNSKKEYWAFNPLRKPESDEEIEAGLKMVIKLLISKPKS